MISVTNIIVGNNPDSVLIPFKFDITFQAFKQLEGQLDWKVTYVGSANDQSYDQIIQSFEMNKIGEGCMQFSIESQPPNFSKIPPQQIVGNTAIVISVAYQGQQFFRVGYYIRNQYDEQQLNQNPPPQPIVNKLKRYIMSENPRISHFQIEWIKHEGMVIQDTEALQRNIEIMGGDPFKSSNGAFEQLQNMSFGYGTFNQQGQIN